MMNEKLVQKVLIQNFEDIIVARKVSKTLAVELYFSILQQTKILTAVSEIARNILVHAKEGAMNAYKIDSEKGKGLKFVFEDKGPGIQDINKAVEKGFSTKKSFGLGLFAAKELSNSFAIDSLPGKGVTVTLVFWS